MKFVSFPNATPDGALFFVNASLEAGEAVGETAPSLQVLLEHWDEHEAALKARYTSLSARDLKPIDLTQVLSPLPRAVQFLDGSAYLPHVKRVRQARGADMPPSFLHDPLMYQAVSDGFLAWHEDVLVASEDYGIDFESEIIVITDAVPMGIPADEVEPHIKLIGVINDVSLRALIPAELKKGFGFIHGKPRSSLAPALVTPDELGDAWQGGKVHLPLLTHYNNELFGEPECGVDMQFSFFELVAHAAKTRPLAAGTMIGSGTVANEDTGLGASCLAEKRMLEIIEHGEAATPFMSFGDRVRIELKNKQGESICGAIDQKVMRYEF